MCAIKAWSRIDFDVCSQLGWQELSSGVRFLCLFLAEPIGNAYSLNWLVSFDGLRVSEKQAKDG